MYGMESPRYKTFSGKVYIKIFSTDSKIAADKKAQDLRKKKYNARVVKGKKYKYCVYAKKK